MIRQETVTHPMLVTLALALGGFAIGVAEFATMSILPFFSEDFGVSEAIAGRAISAYALGVCVGAPLIALGAARVSRRGLLVVLMSAYALANGLSAVAPSWEMFLATRFAAGLPHGAFFGVAGLMAASLVPPERRARAVASVLTGLTVANVVGVPLANLFGAQLGWRWTFAFVVPLAACCALFVRLLAPKLEATAEASPLRELSTLKSRQVWLTLAIGAIGTGGMFCIYSYLASVVIEYAGEPKTVVPLMLMIFGIGMTCGQFIFGWLADKNQMGAAAIALSLAVAMMLAFWAVADNVWLMAPVLLVLGCSGGLGSVLQTRLMTLAEDAPTLSAALNHSAFNFANALGPWMGGIALAAGAGWPSVGLVGAGLGLAGMVVLAITALDARVRGPGRRHGLAAG